MMSSQVYLSPVRLSIISIPRSEVWLFNAAILQLLSEEAQKTPRSLLDINPGGSCESSEGEEEEDSDYFSSESDDESLAIGASIPHLSSPTMTRQNSKTDNSSKLKSPEPLSECGSDGSGENGGNSSTEDEDLDCHFFHFAFTPTECTIICAHKHIDRLFKKPLDACKSLGYDDVILIEKSYLNLQVDSEGDFNNSARIIELTKPLSQHNISLFFLSNHFTDIVLIPYDMKTEVMEILAENNFEFSDVSNSYISIEKSATTSTEIDTSEINTLKLLGEANIRPKIHRKTKLLLTGARPGEVKQSILKASHLIAANTIPAYFSITRSSFNEISLILPSSLTQRSLLGFESKSIIGSALDAVVPITVDLSLLPLNTTGIVAGLAGSLFESMRSIDENKGEYFLMNYLSMARSAVVLIPQEQIYAVSEMIKHMEFKDQ